MSQTIELNQQEVPDEMFERLSNDESFFLVNTVVELYEKRYFQEEKTHYVLDVSAWVPEDLDRDMGNMGFVDTYDSWEEAQAAFPSLHSMLNRVIEKIREDRGWIPGQLKTMLTVISGHRGLYEYDPENPPIIDTPMDSDDDEEDEEIGG